MHRSMDEPAGGTAPAGSRAHPYADGPDPGPGPDPARVDPRVLGVLLRRHGWQRRGGAQGRYSRWVPPGAAATGTSLLVPDTAVLPDSEDLLAEALAALTRSAAPSARDILVALTVPSDEIRWWRDVPEGTAGAADWAGADQLRAAARQVLLAGSLAVRGRAGYHGARHRRKARSALDGTLVGSTDDGRGLTAFVPVTAGRPVAVQLYAALHAAREAVDYQRATGGTEAFDTAVAAGVSRELTEAVVALVRGAEGIRITLAWAPAAGTPEGCPAGPEPVEFSPGDLPALRLAGARYLRDEPPVAVRITGAVVRLRRSGPRGPGVVRLRVLAGAEVAHVRIELDEEAYRIAGHAHLVGLPLRVEGRLENRGGFRRLSGASQVTPVQVDEAERDRLMKSLQENVDHFEEACTGEEG
ncbi:hypothetical protein OG279_30925 [Streptomyces sp. NBC_01201]|uniref:Uncharacterized protein n=2 Tax=Streptomyces TaxID=1883 RepID=A0ABY9JMI1_9ACTN|nr:MULTISPECIES: hypothetical protein [unclassified Streptomyces]WLQ67709.1 hypothetical protein P8A20_30950 [Streptomyces sp. Alt3]WSQ81050.1 hypothetical protein OG725_29915 [Streptomyces sp. NBC_01213]WSR51776.1 hypothetical protein OG279_30925 [Streptomyces sp. NBC_01201]